MNEADLHDYQVAAVEHIMDNTHAGLFLEMGLGKTVSSLTAIKKLMFEELEISKTLVVGPKRSPLSSKYTWLHKSINPFGAGVPVNPMTRLNDGCTPLKALNRIDFGFLNDDNSSMTNMSKGNIEPPYKPHNHDILSRLTRYTSAFFECFNF